MNTPGSTPIQDIDRLKNWFASLATAAALLLGGAPAAHAQTSPQPAMLGWSAPPRDTRAEATWEASPESTRAESTWAVRPADTGRAADEDSPPSRKRARPIQLDLGAATEAPLMVGAQATLELPFRFLIQGEAGWLPPAYVNAIDSLLVNAGTYDETTSQLIRSGLRDSTVLRLSGGFRPFEGHGLELMAGYTLASMGGGVSARQTIEAVTGQTLPTTADIEIPVHSTIHGFHASLGWRWVLADHLVFRASAGYLQAIRSSSGIDYQPSGATEQAVLAEANRRMDTYLNNLYTTYLKTPVIGLSLSYRL